MGAYPYSPLPDQHPATNQPDYIRYIIEFLLGVFVWLLVLVSLVPIILAVVSPFLVPALPKSSLVSISTTVQDISESDHIPHVRMDLNASFMFKNPNKKAIVFQDMKALAYQHGAKVPVGVSTNVIEFEQLGRTRSTQWYRLHNTMTMIDAWVDERGRYGKSGKSGSLHFELRAYATYKGEISNSSKQKIPIKVVCDEMDILFSSNATRTVNLGPRYGRCHVDGIWFGDLAVLEFQHLKYLLLVLVLGCVAVGKARQFGYRRS